MKKGDENYNKKYEFVAELSKVLNMAKPHLTCEFKLGEELPTRDKTMGYETAEGTEYHTISYQPTGEYVVVTCSNGYQYEVNVTADSLGVIAEEVFREMVCK